MLLTYMDAGESGIISRINNPQLEVKGFVKGTPIKVTSKSGNDFLIEINGHKYKVSAAQSRQVEVY